MDRDKLTRWGWGAGRERIPYVALWTYTYGGVVYYRAPGIEATGAWARVPTLFPYTGLNAGTLGVDGALGPTVRWRSHVCRETRTRGRSVNVPTLSIGAARGGIARVTVDVLLWR